MQVIITRAELVAARACDVYLTSPEWNGEALVYSDWNATVMRLLSNRISSRYLDFLVARKLVPMTTEEFIAARNALRGT